MTLPFQYSYIEHKKQSIVLTLQFTLVLEWSDKVLLSKLTSRQHRYLILNISFSHDNRGHHKGHTMSNCCYLRSFFSKRLVELSVCKNANFYVHLTKAIKPLESESHYWNMLIEPVLFYPKTPRAVASPKNITLHHHVIIYFQLLLHLKQRGFCKEQD